MKNHVLQQRISKIINETEDTVSAQIQSIINQHKTQHIDTLKQKLQRNPSNQECNQYLKQNNHKIQNDAHLEFENQIHKSLQENIGIEKTNIVFAHANKNTNIYKRRHIIYGLYRLFLVAEMRLMMLEVNNENFQKLVQTVEACSYIKSDLTAHDIQNIKQQIFTYKRNHASILTKVKEQVGDFLDINPSNILGSLKEKMNFQQYNQDTNAPEHKDIVFKNMVNTPMSLLFLMLGLCLSGLATAVALVFPLMVVGQAGMVLKKYLNDTEEPNIHNAAKFASAPTFKALPNHVSRIEKQKDNSQCK
ncbi:hypothetical protein IAH97_00680 [Neoehrlichia mikurensis]|nr:hypothetical protein [Neoehrlichia mikurensis]QXK92087.1 hypothetical protein IAH97_00680 [Neoehrlichia mikurensis]QXK92544.1 hypothetical protein HUN61_00680 [Neoehrlichia mikurensis]